MKAVKANRKHFSRLGAGFTVVGLIRAVGIKKLLMVGLGVVIGYFLGVAATAAENGDA